MSREAAAGETGRDRGAVTPGVLRVSGLPQVWALRYPALRYPGASAAATAHVIDSLNTMASPCRLGFGLLLRLLPAAFMLVTGHRIRSANPEVLQRGIARLGLLPGVARLLRIFDALALYGGLDGVADLGEAAPA